MTLPPLTEIGPYEILGSLGEGGMGKVYRARDPRLGREVAIKVLLPAFTADPARLKRFEQEARAVALLNHPNILQIYDTGVHEGSPYLVMELLEGQCLRERMDGRPMGMRKTLDIATQIARGLAVAHDKGITDPKEKETLGALTREGKRHGLTFPDLMAAWSVRHRRQRSA